MTVNRVQKQDDWKAKPRSAQRTARAERAHAKCEEANARSYPAALLNDPALRGRGNAPVQATLIRNMQQTYGNRALQRCLQGLAVQRDPEPAEAAKDKGDITITFGPNAVESVVSAHSLEILKDVLRAAGLKSATITSTARTPTDQARAMYQNLVGKGKGQGVAAQKKLYGPAGDKVVDVYVDLKAKKKTADEIKAGMRDKIEEIGPSKVSRHCGDPTKLNVFDVGPNSIGDAKAQKAFKKAANAEVGGRVSTFIPYPQDPGHHFEIKPK